MTHDARPVHKFGGIEKETIRPRGDNAALLIWLKNLYKCCGWDYAKEDYTCQDCAYTATQCRANFLRAWRALGGDEKDEQYREVATERAQDLVVAQRQEQAGTSGATARED